MQPKRFITIFLIKFFAANIRLVIIWISLATLFLYGQESYKALLAKDIHIINHILSFIFAFIIINPFRLIRSTKRLKIYIILLFAIICGLIAKSWVANNTNTFKNLLTTFLFGSNCYFAYLYFLHRQNPENFNPLPERKFPVLLINLGTLFTLFMLFIFNVYVFETNYEERSVLINFLPNTAPLVRFNVTKEALISPGYDISKSPNFRIPTAHLTLQKDTMSQDEYLELYENGKLILRVNFIENAIHTISIHDADGNSQTRPINTHALNAYIRNREGKFIETQNLVDTSFEGDLFVQVHYLHEPRPEYFSNSTNHEDEGEPVIIGTKIVVAKNVLIPQKKKALFPCYFQTKQDWQLSLHDQDREIRLVSGISIWH